jgi:hypothetical protein
MQKIFTDLLAHDPATRGIDRAKLEYAGLRSEGSVQRVCEEASRLLKEMGASDESTMAHELADLFSFRLMFLLFPEECLFGNPVRDKPVISAHLVSMGITPDEDLVRGIKFFVDNFRAKTRSEQTKTSITDVFVRFPSIYDAILGRQRGRCAVCGIVLVYGVNMQLDHVLPWHLGDDPANGSNWQFLCDACNRGKGMLPHYSLSSLFANWIKPSAFHGLSEEVRYAALKRDRRCRRSGKGPGEVELSVIKKVPSGCWILDNVLVVAAADLTKQGDRES